MTEQPPTALERQEARHQAALERIAAEDADRNRRAQEMMEQTKAEQMRRRAQCGTRSGYNRHKREGENPCEACLEAKRAEERERGARKRRREQAKKPNRGC